MTRSEFYQACKLSPSGLMIHIWGNLYSFAFTNPMGGTGITILTGKKHYVYSGIGRLNLVEYHIFDCDGVKHGKMTAYNQANGYAVCNGIVVCGAHASSWVTQYHGCSSRELSFKQD